MDKKILVNENNSSKWYSLSKQAIFEKLNSSEEGLSDTEILER